MCNKWITCQAGRNFFIGYSGDNDSDDVDDIYDMTTTKATTTTTTMIMMMIMIDDDDDDDDDDHDDDDDMVIFSCMHQISHRFYSNTMKCIIFYTEIYIL